MIQTHPSIAQRWVTPAIVILAALAITGWVAFQLGQGNPEGANPLIIGAVVALLLYFIFQQPYLGLAIMLFTLPIDQSLPDIPYVTSLFPVMGAITVLAYANDRYRRKQTLLPRKFHWSWLFGLLFVIWLFISNPDAALRQGRGVGLLTYFQLWVMLWLVIELMDEPKKFRHVMWLFVIGCMISAYVASTEVQMGDTFDTGRNASGGLGGISASARLFTVAFLMLFYLRGQLDKKHRYLIIVTWAMQIFLLQGITATGSRTGILVVVLGIVLMLLSPTSKIKPQRVIIPFIVAFTIYSVVPASYWDSMWNSIFPTIQEGDDTLAIRYDLWEAAIRMVQDKPITGVGVNQFVRNVRAYSDPLSKVYITGAHSIYFSVLAETGVIGFGLYMSMVAAALYSGLRAAFFFKGKDDDWANMAYLWCAILLVLLFAGITKQDQLDKLFWFSFSACAAMETMRAKYTANAPAPSLFAAIRRRLPA